MHSSAFNVVLDQTLPAAMRRFADMPDEERQRLAAQGEAQLEQLRNQPPERFTTAPSSEATPSRPSAPTPPAPIVHPGTRKPNRDRIVTPDEPDEDDLYFQERGQRGWLE